MGTPHSSSGDGEEQRATLASPGRVESGAGINPTAALRDEVASSHAAPSFRTELIQ